MSRPVADIQDEILGKRIRNDHKQCASKRPRTNNIGDIIQVDTVVGTPIYCDCCKTPIYCDCCGEIIQMS
jgi:hypothetical protein